MAMPGHSRENQASRTVSVIIPAYNAGRWLPYTLASVLGQTYRDLEVLFVDDGSLDDTPSVVASLSDSRLTYVYQANQGVAAARNNGLRRATGQYIAFLDADDLWEPCMLESCVSFLEKHPDVDIVRTGYRYVDERGETLPAAPEWFPWTSDVLERLILHDVFVIHAAVIRRQCFDIVGPFDESLARCVDRDMWLRLAAAGFRFGFIPECLAMYRRHNSNVTASYDPKHLQSALAVLDRVFDQPELLPRIGCLKDKAYARVHINACISAFSARLVEEAVAEFELAIELDPTFLTDLDIFYRISCYGLPIGYRPAAGNINVAIGRQHVAALVDCVMGLAHLSHAQKRKAMSTAYLALGMVEATLEQNRAGARMSFARSIRYQPWRVRSWYWLLRSMVA